MKPVALIRTSATIFILLASLSAVLGQAPRPTPTANPFGVTTLQAQPAMVIDPNTGLPLSAGQNTESQWIDNNWKDPDLLLTNVSYDGLPLQEVARDLREQFSKYFDILPMPTAFGRDWGNEINVRLQLRNVKASEVFNAMNLVFENDRTPVRWQLTAPAGGRPLVMLRVLPEAVAAQPAQPHRMVYFVGDLIGDEKSGKMTMDQVVKTITDIWPSDLGKPDDVIHFHREAQLLVVNGTPEQLEFIHQTLAALQQKVAASRSISADLEKLEQLSHLVQKDVFQSEQFSNFVNTFNKTGGNSK